MAATQPGHHAGKNKSTAASDQKGNPVTVNDSHQTPQETSTLVRWLMTSPRTYIFGGLLRHIVNPAVHPEFGDIDLITLDIELMDRLHDAFGYVFREVSRPGCSPRYFLAKSLNVSKPIQLVLMRSHAEAMQFTIEGPQYDIDRAAFSEGGFYFDPTIGEASIKHGINTKRARRVAGPRNMTHFANHRPQIELRHRLKLLQKGFAITE